MNLTCESQTTVTARAARDPYFAKALQDQADALRLNGEPDAARLILDVVEAARCPPSCPTSSA
jgi:hypothetical protein